MGTAVERLVTKMSVVVVPPHFRRIGGKLVQVGGYVYERAGAMPDWQSPTPFWTERVARARAIASAVHEGQYDKSGAEPHIAHVERVAGRVADDPKAMVVAFLHDTVEDTDMTLDQVRREFGAEIAEAVDALTRRSSETYFQFIERTRRSGPLSHKVKVADLRDNYRRSAAWPSLQQRFGKALEVLGAEPEEVTDAPEPVMPQAEVALEIVSAMSDDESVHIGSATVVRTAKGFVISSPRMGVVRVKTEADAAAEVVKVNSSWSGTTKPSPAVERILRSSKKA